MKKLAAASGIVIHEEGNRLYISKKPAAWTNIFLFVNGLLILILLTNGIIQLMMAKNDEGGSTQLGIMLTAIGIVFILLFWRVWLYKKKMNALPISSLKNIAIVDLESNNLLDSQGNLLATLSQVYQVRKMQITSSSPQLFLVWPGGSVSIAKGDPFAGGIGPIQNALQAKGIRRK